MPILTTALLALTPALLHAQATSPAQPRSDAPVLQARLTAPKGVEPAVAAPADAATVRISKLVAPKLIKTVSVDAADNEWKGTRVEREVVVTLTVDTNGVPADVKVVSPTEEELNRRVLKAVSQFRYEPGTMNAVATPFEVRMRVMVQPD